MTVKAIATIAAAGLVALGIAACGDDSSDDSASAEGGKTYAVLTSADFPPMSFRSETNANEVVGFEVDMLKAIMDHLGWKYELKTGDFNGLIPAVQSGRADMVVSDVYNTEERRQVVDFVDYLRNSFAVTVRGDERDQFHGYEDVCGKAMGVLTGSAPELQSARAASKTCTDAGKPAIKIRSFPQVAQELPQLANGNLDAILEEATSLSYIEKTSKGKYVVAFPDEHTTMVGIAIKKGSQLRAKLKSAIDWYIASPQYRSTAKKWGIQERSLLSGGTS